MICSSLNFNPLLRERQMFPWPKLRMDLIPTVNRSRKSSPFGTTNFPFGPELVRVFPFGSDAAREAASKLGRLPRWSCTDLFLLEFQPSPSASALTPCQIWTQNLEPPRAHFRQPTTPAMPKNLHKCAEPRNTYGPSARTRPRPGLSRSPAPA